MEKILSLEQAVEKVKQLKRQNQRVVFTNGCFDILHPGHIWYLQRARALGDVLIVGVNSDRSVKEVKGNLRPILSQQERCQILAGLESVTFVTVFDEPAPLRLIKSILPDVLVKGGDWELDEIVGREEVEGAGGQVVSLPYQAGQSTSGIIERILRRHRTSS